MNSGNREKNSIFQVFLKNVDVIEQFICVLGLSLVTLLVFIQVINRYFLHIETMWIGDIAVYTFAFFMFSAFAYTTAHEGNVAVEVVADKLLASKPLTWRYSYRLVISVLSLLVIGCLLQPSYHFMMKSFKYPSFSTLVPWFNMGWLKIGLFISVVFIFTHQLAISVRDLKRLLDEKAKTKGVDR